MMHTRYFDLRDTKGQQKIIEDQISAAADILRQGGLVGIPTETVYGLSADAPLCYPMLYAERADENGVAHYRVFCFAASPAEPATRETYVLVTLNPATGSVESTEFALDSHSPLMDGDIR